MIHDLAKLKFLLYSLNAEVKVHRLYSFLLIQIYHPRKKLLIIIIIKKKKLLLILWTIKLRIQNHPAVVGASSMNDRCTAAITQHTPRLAHYRRYRGQRGKDGAEMILQSAATRAPAVNKDEVTREDTHPLTVRNEKRRQGNWGNSSHPAEPELHLPVEGEHAPYRICCLGFGAIELCSVCSIIVTV